MFFIFVFRKVSQEKQSLNASRLDAWIKVIKRKDFGKKQTKNAVVCSDHFLVGMFVYLLCMMGILNSQIVHVNIKLINRKKNVTFTKEK